jgi:hypothetical protein
MPVASTLNCDCQNICRYSQIFLEDKIATHWDQYVFSFLLLFFWKYWDLNLKLCTCESSMLPFESHLQSFSFWLVWRMSVTSCLCSLGSSPPKFTLLTIAEMIGVQRPVFSVSQNFLLRDWPETIILFSASQVARITGVSHQHQAENLCFKHFEF